jgi:hypothetical protein
MCVWYTCNLAVDMQIPSRVDRRADTFGEGTFSQDKAPTCQVRVYISNTGHHDLFDTVVNVQTASPITTLDTAVPVGTLRTGVNTPQALLLDFSCDRSSMLTSTEV